MLTKFSLLCGRTINGRDCTLWGNGDHSMGHVYRKFEVSRVIVCFEKNYWTVASFQFLYCYCSPVTSVNYAKHGVYIVRSNSKRYEWWISHLCSSITAFAESYLFKRSRQSYHRCSLYYQCDKATAQDTNFRVQGVNRRVAKNYCTRVSPLFSCVIAGFHLVLPMLLVN